MKCPILPLHLPLRLCQHWHLGPSLLTWKCYCKSTQHIAKINQGHEHSTILCLQYISISHRIWTRVHYSGVIMGTMVSQITSLTIVYSTVYSCADQWKHQCSMSLAFVRGIHQWLVNSPHKWPDTWKMLPFDDVIMFMWFDGILLSHLTHWGQVMHLCISNLAIIVSDNGLSPGRRQTTIWTNDEILLIRTLGTNFSKFLSKIHTF